MPTTARGIRYPLSSAPADVPTDMANMANDVDAAIGTAIAAVAQVPPGVILPYGGATPPAGFLLCDGSAVSRTGATAALFAAIGTVFGPGNGTTTFNLPDLRDRVAMGSSGTKARGSTGGSETHTISVAEMPAHNHGGATGGGTLAAHSTDAGATSTGLTGAGTSGTQGAVSTGGQSSDHSHSGYTSTGGAHSHGSPLSQGPPSYQGEFVVAGPTGDNTTTYSGDKWGTSGASVKATSGTTTNGDHSHSVATYGASNDHTHAVPAHNHSIPQLSIPALTVPALSVGAQPIPPLSISSQGGGAPMSVLSPYLAVNHIIKT